MPTEVSNQDLLDSEIIEAVHYYGRATVHQIATLPGWSVDMDSWGYRGSSLRQSTDELVFNLSIRDHVRRLTEAGYLQVKSHTPAGLDEYEITDEACKKYFCPPFRCEPPLITRASQKGEINLCQTDEQLDQCRKMLGMSSFLLTELQHEIAAEAKVTR